MLLLFHSCGGMTAIQSMCSFSLCNTSICLQWSSRSGSKIQGLHWPGKTLTIKYTHIINYRLFLVLDDLQICSSCTHSNNSKLSNFVLFHPFNNVLTPLRQECCSGCKVLKMDFLLSIIIPVSTSSSNQTSYQNSSQSRALK